MNALEDVPFQTMLGPLEEEVQLVTAPDITVPDCQQILRDNEVTHQVNIYNFEVELIISSSTAIRWLLIFSRVFLET